MARSISRIAERHLSEKLCATADDVQSLGELALRRLRTDIVSAELKPGIKLPFHQLTKQYGVGVSPLRDALSQLAGGGLVISESQKGFRVAPISRDDLKDVMDVRLRIERLALDLAIDRGDAAWDARVKGAYDEFCRVKQRVGEERPITEEWETRHRAFHLTLLSACGSPTLLRFCEQIHDRIHRYRRLALPTKSFMGGIGDDHGEIMGAVRVRDKRRSLNLLDQHIRASNRLIEDNTNFITKPPSE